MSPRIWIDAEHDVDFNRAMIPVYKSDWTDANSVSNAIDYFLDVSERRKDREKLAPFRVERLDYRNQDREAFYKGLERNGPRAVEEFRRALMQEFGFEPDLDNFTVTGICSECRSVSGAESDPQA